MIYYDFDKPFEVGDDNKILVTDTEGRQWHINPSYRLTTYPDLIEPPKRTAVDIYLNKGVK